VNQSIFLDFHLPNAATWFYFSLILTISLFFQFARPFCLRNLDLLTLFLIVPGFLLLQEARTLHPNGSSNNGSSTGGETEKARSTTRGEIESLPPEQLLAYGWLLIGTGYWFVRTLFDLTLVRRPTLSPNLTTAGLACLGLALFVGQSSVAVRRTADQPDSGSVGRRPRPIEQVQDRATAVVQQAQIEAGGGYSAEDVRFWVERTLAMCCHAAVVIGLLMMGLRHFQDRAAGIGMATLYLLIPYTAYNISQLHHVWPTAFLVWAIYFYKRPITAGWLLGLAAGSSLFPILLLPLWIGFYFRRGAGRFSLAFLSAATVSVGVTSLILWLGGEQGLGLFSALNLEEWLPWKFSSVESIWKGAHWAYRMPIFVLFVGLLCGITVWPNPKNLSHLIALSAAVLIGVQFWYADRGGVYVLWYMPLLIMMVFRPNLVLAEAPPLVPGSGIMVRLASAAWRRVRPGPNPPKQLAV
jgi:hypothetical protein